MSTLTLIETGGTICMEDGPDGLRPAPDRLARALAHLAPGLAFRHIALQPLVDSAEVGPATWNWMLDQIEAASGPVLVTHGTDTLAFTGAALDAALAGQAASVVLVGSMHPLGVAGGDAEANLALAVDVASKARPGLWLAFDGKVQAAGALAKVHSMAAGAFAPVGDVSPAPQPKTRRYKAGLNLGCVSITPGLSSRALEASLSALDGAVLEVFGAGTVPSHLAQAIHAAGRAGCRMLAISQCAAGGLEPGAYAAGAALWAAGVENGGQLSTEQALARLWLALSAE